MKKLLILLTATALISGCTDAGFEKLSAYGDKARVTCYSGGTLVFDDFSTGKVISESNSDGYYFKSQTTKRAVEISGDCRIDYGAETSPGWKPVGIG